MNALHTLFIFVSFLLIPYFTAAKSGQTALPDTVVSDSKKPLSKTYKPCPLSLAKSSMTSGSVLWIHAFSGLEDEKIDQESLFNYVCNNYRILHLDEEARNPLQIKGEEEMIWLTVIGAIILEKWECDNDEDEMFKEKLTQNYINMIEGFSDEQLVGMTKWAIDNESHLKFWLYDKIMMSRSDRNAYRNLINRVIHYTLDILTSHGMASADAVDLAMKSAFEKYDGTQCAMDFIRSNLNYRAIDIMLKWGDKDSVVNLVKQEFDPSDTRNLFNNLWIVETLSQHGLEDAAEQLTLSGDSEDTPSILLNLAVKSYSTLDYERQAEMRYLIRRVQRFVFK